MSIPLPIATGSYTSEILTLAAQTCSNWIPIIPQGGALNERALLDRPGLTKFATLSGPHRGAIDFNGVYITLNGTTLSSVASDGTATTLGTVTGSGPVSMAKNDDFVVIVTNLGDGFYYNGSTVTQITDTDYTDIKAKTVCFVDGYFVFSRFDGTQFFLSAINDPSSFDALDRSTAEERPDPIVACFVYNNLLHVAGTETTEKYNNRGGVNFPFQRINQASSSVGCYSRFTPIEFNNTYCWIGAGKNEGAQIQMLSGGQPQVISTPAIDTELQKFEDGELDQAISMVWQQNGQSIIAFTIASDRITDRTFCFNSTSGEWFELKSGTSAFRGRSVVRIYNKLLVGDDSSQVGYFDSSARTDYGNAIFREKASQPFLSQTAAEFRIGKIEAWFEAGTGSASVSPQLMMDFSDDLGKTWQTETWRGIGEQGQYGVRAKWRKQGLVTRNRVYRFKASDPYLFNFMKLTAN